MTYTGHYPNRIKQVSSMTDADGLRSLSIKTNAGALFSYEPKHREAPLPKIAQEIEEWAFFIKPMNDAARAIDDHICGVAA